jgi:Flp pilus assembly protein CpaB
MQNLLSTRTGTMVVGGFAAVLAGAVLLFYIAQYRDSVRQEQKPVAVLVANQLIPKGTSGDLIGSQQMYAISKIPANRVSDGAITDPNSLKGRVVVEDLFPGKQLTSSDFTDVSPNDLTTKITATQRAMAVPLDAAHGLIGYVQAGDHVDVVGGFNIDNGIDGKSHPVQETLMQNVLVLDAPSSSSKSGIGTANATANVVLLVDDKQAVDLAFASDNGKIWLELRPQTGAQSTDPLPLATLETELFGVKSVSVYKAYHRYLTRAFGGVR